MGEDLERLKQRIPLLQYLQQHNWSGRPVAAISVPTPIAEKASASPLLRALDPLRADIVRHSAKSFFTEHCEPIPQAVFAIFKFRGTVKQPRLPHFQAAAL